MKLLSLLLFMFAMTFTAHAGFEGLNQGKSAKLFTALNCGTGISCSRAKNTFNLVASGAGVLRPRVSAVASTLTSAQCGSTFFNAGAVELELPDAALVLGCRYTFVVLNATNFVLDPDPADIILVQTNAAGDSITNATLGNVIMLEAVSASQWAPISVTGTWTDTN